jgi:TonB family protein
LALAFALLPFEAPAQTGPTPDEAESLNARVLKLAGEGKYAEALPLARRVLEMRSRASGDEHPSVAGAHMNVAVINQELGNSKEAQSSYKRAHAIYEKGGEHYAAQTARALDGMARLATSIGDAVSLHERALKLKEKAEGPQGAGVASTLFQLGHLYEMLDDYGRAEESFERVVEIRERTKAGVADDAAVALLRLGCLSKKRGKQDEPAELNRRAGEILKDAGSGGRRIVEGGVLNGKVVSKPAPSYPAEARNARAEGKVDVHILVGEAGDVLAACGEGNHRSLEAASERAAYAARFTPTTVGGKPVKVRGVITYNYVLR